MKEKPPEYYKAREEARRSARENLPLDKQLAHPAERPEKSVGVPAAELLALRHSADPEDIFFVEYLRQKIKEKMAKEIGPEETEKLENLKGEKEKERRDLQKAVKVMLFYEKGLKDSDNDVRCGTAESLGALAPVNPELAATLYEKGLRDPYSYIRQGTAKSLGALAPVNPELAATLYEKGLKDSDNNVRQVTAESLGALAPVNPELAATLYEKGLEDSDDYVRCGTAKSLGALAPVNPELAATLYEKGLRDPYGYINQGTAKSLGALAPVNPELAATLYEKGLEDSYDYVRQVTAESLGALAPVNPELYATLYEKGLEDSNSAVRRVTAKSLGALAPVNPEFYATLYEKGLEDSDNDVRRVTAESLGALAKETNFNQLNRIRAILKAKGVSSSEKIYLYTRLADKIEAGEDLGHLILEDLPAFRALKEYSAEVNKNLPEEKQCQDTEKFWQENQSRLARLITLGKDKGLDLVNLKLNNFGFSRLERTLALVDSLNSSASKLLKETMAKTETADSSFLEKLLELTDAYQRMGLDSKLKNELENLAESEKINKKETIENLSRRLLQEFSRSLGLETEISPDALAKWDLEYLSKLFFAEKSFEDESKEALKLIVKATLQGDFEKMMRGAEFDLSGYNGEEQDTIEEIQEHREKVAREFKAAGLNFDLWEKYSQTREFRVGVPEKEKAVRFDSFRRELSEVAVNVLGSRQEKRAGILAQKKAVELYKSVFQKYGLKFENGEIVTAKAGKGKLSPLDIQPVLADTISFLEKELEATQDLNLGTNLDHLRNLAKMLPDIEKESKQKGYQLKIKLWDRQPGHDIFQGNYTHCCIAVENFNRAAILDYLTDAGMNIIEIKDETTDQTIAQTFVFLAQNETGENIMVLDNVEVNNDYRGVAGDIRRELFDYVAEYAGQLPIISGKKIERILLGTAYNDIETGDLNSRQEVVKKIGGSGVSGTQYLDSFGSAWVDAGHPTLRRFHVALDNLRENKEIKEGGKPRFHRAELMEELDEETLNQIASVEEASFPPEMQSDSEDLAETLENKKGIQLMMRNQEGKIIGYLSSKPQKDAADELKEWDHEFEEDENSLYIESIALRPEERSPRTLVETGKKLFAEAQRKGFRKITMHARVEGGLSNILQKRYGAKQVRRLENWHNFNEPFDYLELEVPLPEEG